MDMDFDKKLLSQQLFFLVAARHELYQKLNCNAMVATLYFSIEKMPTYCQLGLYLVS